ncbi:MAG: LysR family transcriptional regulator [Deltaproteobacteria bacterium]|nr:LysR family transcriptional regulator [Deltaproteobacteria bacterium]
MDWRSVTFDWNRARAFLVTAEQGSFSAAGRALGIAQPTIGRQVAALEQELDVILFERVGQGLELTPTGVELVEHVRVMGEAALKVSLAAAGQSTSLDGTVCISASEVNATYVLPPVIADLREAHPGITVEIIATNSPSDLSRREADIAIRSFRPTQPQLVARKVRDGFARLYASPEYLATIGDPTTAEQLSQAQFLGFGRGDALMKGLNAIGLSLTLDNFPVITENQLVQWELTKRGVGVAIMLEEVGDAEPLVRRALPDLPPIPVPMWLTTHRELNTSRRLRVVFDLLFEGLAAQ